MRPPHAGVCKPNEQQHHNILLFMTLSPDTEGDTWFEIVNRVKQPLINDESEKDELQRC